MGGVMSGTFTPEMSFPFYAHATEKHSRRPSSRDRQMDEWGWLPHRLTVAFVYGEAVGNS
jgi:hypothetical protein